MTVIVVGGDPNTAASCGNLATHRFEDVLARSAPEVVCVPDALMRELSGLESPAPIGFLIEAEQGAAPRPGVRTVVLDRR